MTLRDSMSHRFGARTPERRLGVRPGARFGSGAWAIMHAALSAAALGCGAGEAADAAAEAGLLPGDTASGALGDGGEPSGEPGGFAAPTCAAPPGLPAPSSIAAAVEWINRLPKPLSLACFLESLERPLPVHASVSLFSAQPAVGRRSPRIFLFEPPLIMSVVPEGIGSHLLEFGEQRSPRSSLKAEIPFPVIAELAPSAPYDHVEPGGFTTCGGCHGEEEPASDVPFARAFISRALRPRPRERVPLDELELEARECDAAAEPERCAMLVAIFGQGGVVEAEFPETMDTFY